MAILRERKGKKPDTVYPVLASRSPTVIGRDESADVTLDDDRSSRRHAGIVRRYGSWIIQDLKSSNGTLVGGEKIDKKRLEDGATIQIGNTLLEFQPHELAPPPEGELEGARLLETLREEGGCFVFRAYQRALDREVRIDQISSTRPPGEEILAKLATAVQAAARVGHDRVEPVVASDLEERRGAFVVLRTKEGATLEKVLDDVLAAGIGVRLAILRSIAEVVLARGDNAILCVPLALDQLKLRTDDVPRVFVAGIELPAFLSLRAGTLVHSAPYAPYLAPELGRGEIPDDDGLRAAEIYSLGAVGYHLLTGRRPMGEGRIREVLANHQTLKAMPASLLEPEIPEPVSTLLEHLLAKSPQERPTSPQEILGTLASCDLPLDEFVLTSIEDDTAEHGRAMQKGDLLEEGATNDDRDRPALATSDLSRGSTRTPGAGRPWPRGPTTERREKIPEDPREKPRSSVALNVVSLPLWAGVWAGLFFGAWKLSKMLFVTFLG